jgi:nicotinic acid mononucleotide adenylyltransferase
MVVSDHFGWTFSPPHFGHLIGIGMCRIIMVTKTASHVLYRPSGNPNQQSNTNIQGKSMDTRKKTLDGDILKKTGATVIENQSSGWST